LLLRELVIEVRPMEVTWVKPALIVSPRRRAKSVIERRIGRGDRGARGLSHEMAFGGEALFGAYDPPFGKLGFRATARAAQAQLAARIFGELDFAAFVKAEHFCVGEGDL